MCTKSSEKFLRAFEKQIQLQKWDFDRILQPHFELHFFKIPIFFTFSDI
eukprot:UN21273